VLSSADDFFLTDSAIQLTIRSIYIDTTQFVSVAKNDFGTRETKKKKKKPNRHACLAMFDPLIGAQHASRMLLQNSVGCLQN
jgi:hypothetical protein